MDQKFKKLETYFVDLSVKIDRVQLLTKQQNTPSVVKVDEPPRELFPLDSTEETNKFEISLRSDTFKLKIIAHLRKIIGCGTSWKSAAYRLSSILFTKY